MTTEPQNVRKWVDDDSESYQPVAEYILLTTIHQNPQIELNQLFVLLSGLMNRPRFNRAYKVVSQLRYNGFKVVVVRPNNKSNRTYLSVNSQLQITELLQTWYAEQHTNLHFVPPAYVTRKR